MRFTDLPHVHARVAKVKAVDADPRGGRITLGSEVIDAFHPWARVHPFRDSNEAEFVDLFRKGLAFHDDGAPVQTEAGFVWTVGNGGRARALTVEDSSAALPADFFARDPGVVYFETFEAEDILDRGDGYWEAGEYGIKLTGPLSLLYQTPLTAEEIAEGCRRPIEMEGGFCVYHDHKMHNTLDRDGAPLKTYLAGKVANIPRPYAECYANGNVYLERVYGKWERRAGSFFKLIPVAEIPQGTARAEVDATLGYTSIGVSSSIGRITQTNGPWAAGENFTVGKAYLYSQASGNTGYFAVYGNSGSNTPDGQALVSNSQSPNLTTSGGTKWHSVDYTTGPSLTNGTSYHIGFLHAAGTESPYYDAGATGWTHRRNSITYATAPNPCPTLSLGLGTVKMSMYFESGASTSTVPVKDHHYKKMRG